MQQYQKNFALALARTPKALLIDRPYIDTGEVTLGLKDERRALYFVNMGAISTGMAGTEMGKAYAHELFPKSSDFDIVFGPAYKGITIGNEAVGALWRTQHVNRKWAYRRKEAKGHGEKGAVIGGPILDGERIWLVDDVITSARTKIDEMEWIRGYGDENDIGIEFTGLTVGVDRQQKAVITDDKGKRQLDVTAAQYFTDETELPVDVVLPVTELMHFLHDEKVEDSEGIVIADDDFMRAFEAYQEGFGV